MNHMHHMPGRLRLKFPQLKGRFALANAVEKAIRPLPGVRLTQANVVTGSLLIHYDARGAQETALLEMIEGILTRQFGLALPGRISGTAGARSESSRQNPIADRVVDMMIETLVERSALALLGALL